MDSRVIARMSASASATSPTTCAPATGAPSGNVAESATGCAPLGSPFAWPGVGLSPDEGLIVGNKPDTLPPGLRVEPEPFSEGSPTAGIVEVDPGMVPVGEPVGRAVDEELLGELVGELLGLGAAVTDTDTGAVDAPGFTPFAVAVAVSLTDVTELAFEATWIWAKRSLKGLVGSIVPTVLEPMNVAFWPDG